LQPARLVAKWSGRAADRPGSRSDDEPDSRTNQIFGSINSNTCTYANPSSDIHAHANSHGHASINSHANPNAYSDTGADHAQCESLQGAGAADGGSLLEWGYLEQYRHLSYRRVDCHCTERPQFLHRWRWGDWQGHLHL